MILTNVIGLGDTSGLSRQTEQLIKKESEKFIGKPYDDNYIELIKKFLLKIPTQIGIKGVEISTDILERAKLISAIGYIEASGLSERRIYLIKLKYGYVFFTDTKIIMKNETLSRYNSKKSKKL